MTESVLTRKPQARKSPADSNGHGAAADAASNGRFQQLDTAALGITNLPPYVPAADTTEMPQLARSLEYEVVSDRLVTLSKAKCTEYLNLTAFEGERNPSPDSAQYLIDEINSRTFNASNVLLASCWLGKTRTKLNGQHTCWAWLLAKEPEAYKVREIIYRVKGQEQLKLLYNSFDRNRRRSDTFSVNVLLLGTPLAKNLWTASLPIYITGMRFWLYGEDRKLARRLSPNHLCQLASTQHELVFRRVGLFMQHERNAFSTGIRRGAVIGAMFATFDKAPRQATEFWQSICDGLGLTKKSDPRWRLREVLARSVQQASSKRGTKRERLFLSPEDIYRVCLVCWNAWRAGEEMHMTPRPTSKRIDPV